MGWTGGHAPSTLSFFASNILKFLKLTSAGWPSGQRCKLAGVGIRVRSQPKSNISFHDFELILNLIFH